MVSVLLDFIVSLVINAGWVFFPLFLVGFSAWYLLISVYSHLLKRLIGFSDAIGNNKPYLYCFVVFFFKSKKRSGIYQKAAAFYFNKYLKQGSLNQKSSKDDFEKFLYNFFKVFYRDIRTISILAGVAPLLGLLGTVTGMINTFEVISLYGNSNPILMADGISEAMLTTQIGLLISFPLLLIIAKIKHSLSVLKNYLFKEFITCFSTIPSSR